MLYTEDAVHITAEQTIQGRTAIKTFYTDLFTKRQPNVIFSLTSMTGNEPTRNFGWTSTFSSSTRKGTDTLGLIDGSIAYHYSSFC